ncbi:hypothetical protein BT93_B0367 [Corymbia citriodora subsp. variegata]|nr:hypothetical protein BT93_B0367 [Corymbia citriodora subsp. variegata]
MVYHRIQIQKAQILPIHFPFLLLSAFGSLLFFEIEREREREREREMWESICLTLVATAGNNIGKVLQKKGTVILPPFSFKLKVIRAGADFLRQSGQ